jgi:heme exporter protein A
MEFATHQLLFERNNQVLFSELNITLHQGECLQVQGANGSGKSTLLRILAGLIEPVSGDVLWNHQSIFKQRENYQQQLQYLGHQNGMKRYLTVLENLQFSSALNMAKSDCQQIKSVIKHVGLDHLLKAKAFTLSAGQARRLSLAKILLNPALLWILDEPLTALDTEGKQLFADILNQHLVNGGMVIAATHQNFRSKTKVIRL